MTQEELFKKYSIDKSHSEWNFAIDNWVSVEIFRFMHNGRLPESEDTSLKYITDFLDNMLNKEDPTFVKKLMKEHSNWGSFYLTAKRMIYKYADFILKEINELTAKT